MNCLSIGVIVRPNFEMPTQATGSARTTPEQLSDQSPQLFSDSMLAASKASTEAGATNDSSPKAAREQRYTLVENSTSPAAPDHHAVPAPLPSSRTVLSQPLLQTPQAQPTSPAATPIDLPLGGVMSSPNISIAVAGQAMSLDVAAGSTADELSGDQSSEAQSFGVQSGHARLGSDPQQTQSKLAGAKFQSKGVPVAHSSKAGNDRANSAMAAASNGLENPGQKAGPSIAPTGMQNSLPGDDPSELSISGSNAVQIAAPQAPSNTEPNAVLNAPASASLNATSNAAPNAVQGMVPNETTSGTQDSFAKIFIDTLSNTSLNANSIAAPNAIQSTAPSAVTSEMQDLFPRTDLNGLSVAAPIDGANATQDSAPIGMQDSLSKADLSGLSIATPNGSSNAAPNAVQSGALNAGPRGMQDSLPNADLNGLSIAATNFSSNGATKAVQSVVANPVPDGMRKLVSSADLSGLSIATTIGSSIAAPYTVQSGALNAGPRGMQDSLPNADLSGLSTAATNFSSNGATKAVQSVAANPVPNGMQELRPNADLSGLSITTPDGSSNAVPNAVPGGMQDSLPNADLSGLSNAPKTVTSNVAPNSFESTAQNPAPNWLQKSFLKAVLQAFASAGPGTLSNAAPNAPARIIPNNGPDEVLGAVRNVVPNSVQNATPDAVLNPASGALSGAEQLPVPHAVPPASTKGVIATPPGNVSPAPTNPPAASPDQTILANGLSLPAATVDQFGSLAQFSSRSLVEGQAGLTGVNPASSTKPLNLSASNGKDEFNDASDDDASTKLHASPEASQPKLQTNNQEMTPSGDQGQNSSALQGQNTVRPEMNFANHADAAVSATQATVNPSPAQDSAIPAGATAHTAKTQDNATPAPISAPQALPVINTAKLIQSMGQSEMRVGMRSTEFGNISISTSSTRDLISAQISLDHGELARTLAAHLPEIQARLGGNQPADVRIDMNGASAGQTGTAGGMYNGSADQSRGGRHQVGNADSSSSGNRLDGQQLSPVASATATSGGGVSARLDIRV